MLPVVPILVLIVLWWIACTTGIFPTNTIPTPQAVAVAFFFEVINGRLLNDAVVSLFRVCCGFLAAIGIGIPVGVWMGQYPPVQRALLPMANFFRNLSPLAWMPFAILWFGVGDLAAIFLIFLSVLFPMTLSTMTATANVPTVYLWVAKDYDIGNFERLTGVILPAIMPELVTSIRVSAGIAWLIDVAAEMIAGRDGLGFAVMDSRNGLRIDLLVVQMIAIGIIGVTIDRILVQLTQIPSVRWGFER